MSIKQNIALATTLFIISTFPALTSRLEPDDPSPNTSAAHPQDSIINPEIEFSNQSQLLLTDLPLEVIEYILGFSRIRDGVSLAATCRTFHFLNFSPSLWNRYAARIPGYQRCRDNHPELADDGKKIIQHLMEPEFEITSDVTLLIEGEPKVEVGNFPPCRAVNDDGTMVSHYKEDTDLYYKVLFWKLENQQTQAFEIHRIIPRLDIINMNADHLVVGHAKDLTFGDRAAIWNPCQGFSLLPPASEELYSQAEAVNVKGTVSGISIDKQDNQRAVTWKPGEGHPQEYHVKILESLGDYSKVVDINADGTIVGMSGDEERTGRAVIAD